MLNISQHFSFSYSKHWFSLSTSFIVTESDYIFFHIIFPNEFHVSSFQIVISWVRLRKILKTSLYCRFVNSCVKRKHNDSLLFEIIVTAGSLIGNFRKYRGQKKCKIFRIGTCGTLLSKFQSRIPKFGSFWLCGLPKILISTFFLHKSSIRIHAIIIFFTSTI